jgi:hypothetical protein
MVWAAPKVAAGGSGQAADAFHYRHLCGGAQTAGAQWCGPCGGFAQVTLRRICAGCARLCVLEGQAGGASCSGRQAVKRPGIIGGSYQMVTKFSVFY